MRDAAAKLMGRNILGRDVFGRGNPEPLIVETQREYADNLIDLLKAYAERRQRINRTQADGVDGILHDDHDAAMPK